LCLNYLLILIGYNVRKTVFAGQPKNPSDSIFNTPELTNSQKKHSGNPKTVRIFIRVMFNFVYILYGYFDYVVDYLLKNTNVSTVIKTVINTQMLVSTPEFMKHTKPENRINDSGTKPRFDFNLINSPRKN